MIGFVSLVVTPCSARSWVTVVDSAIFLASAIDYGRLEKALERDPFDFTDGHPATEAPSSTPTKTVQEGAESPTILPSQLTESQSPSLSPTPRYMNIVGNGGCQVGKSLYEIRLTDEWGDGWDETVMQITGTKAINSTNTVEQYSTTTSNGTSTVSMYSSIQVKQANATTTNQIFKGRLTSGSEEYHYICLQHYVCYTVDIGGGTWESEIKWDIQKVDVGVPREDRDNTLALAKGMAPESCQFSIADSSGARPCPVTCGMRQTEAPTTTYPSLAPSLNSSTSVPTTDSSTNKVEEPSPAPYFELPTVATVIDASTEPSIDAAHSTSDIPSLTPLDPTSVDTLLPTVVSATTMPTAATMTEEPVVEESGERMTEPSMSSKDTLNPIFVRKRDSEAPTVNVEPEFTSNAKFVVASFNTYGLNNNVRD